MSSNYQIRGILASLPVDTPGRHWRLIMALETIRPDAEGWRTISMKLLGEYARLSQPHLRKARDELTEAGRIEYKCVGARRGAIWWWKILIPPLEPTNIVNPRGSLSGAEVNEPPAPFNEPSAQFNEPPNSVNCDDADAIALSAFKDSALKTSRARATHDNDRRLHMNGWEDYTWRESPDPAPDPAMFGSDNPDSPWMKITLPARRVKKEPPPPRDDVERLCVHLADRIEGNGSKRPEITKRWRDAARLMLDNDGRTEQQIHTAIDWCQDHTFWCSNILGMSRLRSQYDQLRLQATRGNGNGKNAEGDAMLRRAMERAIEKEGNGDDTERSGPARGLHPRSLPGPADE